MTKTIVITAALVLSALTSFPAQAASRLMLSSPEGFQYRCENHGGAYGNDGALATCHTPSVLVACEYFEARQANCQWPGIERQIDVVRVIGSLPGGAEFVYSSNSGGNQAVGNGGNVGGGGNGGFQGPNNLKDGPGNNPKPGFDGPTDFQIAP